MILWNSSTLATSCKELTHWKRLWCWEGLGAGGEGDDRGWDGWMASLTRWMWVWVDSGSWWWAGRPGVLQFMGSQRVGHDWATELNWTECILFIKMLFFSINSFFLPCVYLLNFPVTQEVVLRTRKNLALSRIPPPLCYTVAGKPSVGGELKKTTHLIWEELPTEGWSWQIWPLRFKMIIYFELEPVSEVVSCRCVKAYARTIDPFQVMT